MTHRYGFIKTITFSLLPALIIFITLEIATRAYFAFKYHGLYYLSYPLDARGDKKLRDFKTVKIYDSVRHMIEKAPDNSIYYKSISGIYRETFHNKPFLIRINQWGFRGKEFSLIKPAGIFRIFCLGGSSTEGLQVSSGLDYPSILENKLNSYNPNLKYEVINAGFLGVSSDEMLALFTYDILKYRPDMITIYAGFNDYHGSLDGTPPITNRAMTYIYRCLYSPVFSSSLFITVLREKACIYTSKIYGKFYTETIINRFKKNIRNIIEIAKKNNVQVILAKQGIFLDKFGSVTDSGIFSVISTKINAGKRVSREEAYYYIHYRILETIDRISEETSIKLANTNAALSKYPPQEVYYDIVHLTEQGNDIIAQSLLEPIKDYVDSRAVYN